VIVNEFDVIEVLAYDDIVDVKTLMSADSYYYMGQPFLLFINPEQEGDLLKELGPVTTSGAQVRSVERFRAGQPITGLYPLIANSNPGMAQMVFQDFVRRSRKPQTPAMLRGIFSNASPTSSGGIILPANKVEINVDLVRIQRIAGKIARGVVFLKTGDYCPETNIVDMRICESESEVPEMYQLSWKATSMESIYPKVFSFKYFPFLQGYYILSLLFWGAFMFCVTIQQ